MPGHKKTWLKPEEVESYLQILQVKKARILKDVHHLEDRSLHNSADDAGSDNFNWNVQQADVSSDVAECDMMLELASSEQKMVQKIDHAIKRIEAGTYGTCELTGCKISKARLDAMPEATICMKCMNKYNL